MLNNNQIQVNPKEEEMNKKAKVDSKTILVIAIILALLIGIYWYSSVRTKTVLEHKEPADISKNEKGTGIDLKLYDTQGNEITIPQWFSTASIIEPQFTIVRHPPAPTCTDRTQCSGYATNPNIMCWTGTCALGNVASLTMGVSVTNPSSSQLSFTNLAPTTVLPTEFNAALTKTPYAKLSPGQTTSWTSSAISVVSWTGSKTFSSVISGTNEYTGAINTVSDSLTLDFASDPTGSLAVSIVSPI